MLALRAFGEVEALFASPFQPGGFAEEKTLRGGEKEDKFYKWASDEKDKVLCYP